MTLAVQCCNRGRLSDARKKSVELTIAIVPAGTSFPAVWQKLCNALARQQSPASTTPEGLTIPIDEQTANYKAILAEGGERLKALGFSLTSRLEIGDAGQKISEVAEEIDAHLVVVGHRPQGRLARWWFSSVGSYLVKRLRCSVLVAQTEISDDEFEQLKPPSEKPASGQADTASIL